nr:hypothetical protein [Mucilaginibacter sp. SP1R1]
MAINNNSVIYIINNKMDINFYLLLINSVKQVSIVKSKQSNVN